MLQNGELQVSELESYKNYGENNQVLSIQTYVDSFFTTKLENVSEHKIEFRNLKGELERVGVSAISSLRLYKCATLEQYGIEYAKDYTETGQYISITGIGNQITKVKRVISVDGLYFYVEKLDGGEEKVNRIDVKVMELAPIEQEDIEKLLKTVKALKELETHKNYYEDENKVIKLVNSKGIFYLTTIFDVSPKTNSVYGKDIEHRHLNISSPFDEVKLLHLKPLEDYGVMPLENYYNNDKILKVTLSNGDTEYLKDIQTITIAYYYATSFDSETKTIKREDVVNIEILDMIDGVIQEDTNTSRPTTLKSMLQEKPIQTAKDYSLDSRLVKVTTDASEMYFKFIDNVDEKDVVLRGMGEDDRPYVIPYYRILDIEVVPKVLENVESNDDGLKLGEIEVGKHYGLEDKVINIVTEDGDYLVYGVSEIEGDSMYCMTTDYDNIEIPLRDVRHVAMHTRYNLEKWGIVPSLDYSTENMYVKVTFNNGETVVADSVSHIDVIYYRLLDAVGKPVKVSCENVRNMEVHERGNHMPVSKGIKLLMVGNVKIGTDYSEEEKEIIVKTSNVKHIFKLCVGVSTGNESIAFLNHEDIRKDVPVSDILKVYLKDIKTTGLKAIPLNLNSEPSTEKEETPHEDDFDVSDLFNLTDDVFEYYGVEEGKDYRKESKLLQVKLEDNVLVFANLESDMEGWVAGRQFGSITTSVPVSKIKDIKVVDIADLM